jgi:hypothetical protein
MNHSVTAHNFFDTHAFVKELEKAGFSEQQAEVLANKQAELIENRLATKKDLESLEQRVVNNIALARKDTIIAIASMITVAVGIMLAAKVFV